jgi:hypothetical protein
MIVMQQRNVRAAEYRRLAENATLLAEGSTLEHVREKHQRAAATWASLAELDEQPSSIAPPEALNR